MVKMRIISQDGFIDLPYENIGVSINHSDNTEIIAYPTYVNIIDKGFWKIAKYSTEAKAQKAMEMLREEYGKHIYGQGGAMATANFYVPPFAFIPPKIFQFPKDEDVEV